MTSTALPSLPTRSLGDLTVPAVGYGAMVLSPGVYGDIDDDRALAAVRHAIDAGATFVDTSDYYGGAGQNEALVGRAIAGRRDEVVVATKFGLNLAEGAEIHRFPVGYASGNQHPAVVPIPGSHAPAHIDENLAAARIELDDETLAAADRLLAATVPVGDVLL